MRNLIITLFALICGSSVKLAAQTPGATARTCRILFLSPPETAPKKVLLFDGAKCQEIELPSMNMSEIYVLSPGNVTLALLAQPPVEGQPLPKDTPSAALPEEVKDCYLLLASDPKNKAMPLQLQVIDANSGNFKAGQMMWFNLSPFEVGGQLGKNNISVKPNSRIIVDPPTNIVEDYAVRLGYSPGKGKRAEPLFATLWRHDPAARNVIFVTMAPNARFPQVRGFVDSRNPEKKQ